MPAVEELVVAAKPEGIEETTDQLEEMEEGFEETGDEMEDTADGLSDLQGKWQGAMGAIVAGLAVAVGGILSQVPVLGQAMEGLGAIAAAFGFQLNQLLRDLGAGGFIDWLFSSAEAVFAAEGAWGDLVGVLTGVAAVLTTVIAGIIAYGAAFTSVSGALAGAYSALQTVAAVIAAVAGGVSALTVGIALLVAAVAALAVAMIFNIGGIRDKTIAFFWEMVNAARNAGDAMYSGLVGALEGVTRAIALPVLDGINAVISTINGVVRKLPDSVKSRVGVGTLGTVSAGDIGLDPEGGIGSGNAAANVKRRQEVQVRMDGRNLVSQDGKYRRDQTSRRGTDG